MIEKTLMACEVVYISFIVAVFAKIMQNLCKSAEFEHFGTYPLSELHKKIARYLHKRRLKILLKLHYCFKCQSVWYALLYSVIISHNFEAWQVISLPFFTYFFANLIIKEEYFEAIYDEQDTDKQ